jgi:hypothetical protein
MERSPVKSSCINSIGYENEVLEVAFTNGRIYRYNGVPSDLYESIMAADSKGRAVINEVINGGFEAEQIDPAEE